MSARETVERALQLVKKREPKAESSCIAFEYRSGNTRFAAGSITSTGESTATAISLEVAIGRRHVAVNGNQPDADALSRLVERALAAVRRLPEDPEHLPFLGPQKYDVAPTEYDEATAALDAVARARAVSAIVQPARALGAEAAGFLQHTAAIEALGTSAGLYAEHRSTHVELTTTIRTNESGSGWAGTASHRFADVDAAALGKTALDGAQRSRRPRSLAAGRYSVVLLPAAAMTMADFLVDALTARDADEGRSCMARSGGRTRLGEKMFAPFVQIASDPGSPELPDAPFDGEGLPRRPTRWISGGRVEALQYSRFWAEKKKKAPSGYHSSYVLSGGRAASVEELCRGMKRGLLISRFWYCLVVDPRQLNVTGLTRDGVFLVENGEIVGPVNNFRFNESPLKVFKRCDAMTAQTFRLPGEARDGVGWRTPALRTHDFNLASVSDAV